MPSIVRHPFNRLETCLVLRLGSPSSAIVSIYANPFSPSAWSRTRSAGTSSSRVSLTTSPTLMSLHCVRAQQNPLLESSTGAISSAAAPAFIDHNDGSSHLLAAAHRVRRYLPIAAEPQRALNSRPCQADGACSHHNPPWPQ